MRLFKIFALIAVSLWTFSIWTEYLNAQDNSQTQSPLSQNFWKWEAEGRLKLIDSILDDEYIAKARQDFHKTNLEILAAHLVELQTHAYGMPENFKTPSVYFTPLRGDANGVYMPMDQAIYINAKMQWASLNFERFIEVILHENMHHILTFGHQAIGEGDMLFKDLELLRNVGLSPSDKNVMHRDLQEDVAYRAERAARYAGIMNAGLSAWDMSTRMQEIRVIKEDANR